MLQSKLECHDQDRATHTHRAHRTTAGHHRSMCPSSEQGRRQKRRRSTPIEFEFEVRLQRLLHKVVGEEDRFWAGVRCARAEICALAEKHCIFTVDRRHKGAALRTCRAECVDVVMSLRSLCRSHESKVIPAILGLLEREFKGFKSLPIVRQVATSMEFNEKKLELTIQPEGTAQRKARLPHAHDIGWGCLNPYVGRLFHLLRIDGSTKEPAVKVGTLREAIAEAGGLDRIVFDEHHEHEDEVESVDRLVGIVKPPKLLKDSVNGDTPAAWFEVGPKLWPIQNKDDAIYHFCLACEAPRCTAVREWVRQQ